MSETETRPAPSTQPGPCHLGDGEQRQSRTFLTQEVPSGRAQLCLHASWTAQSLGGEKGETT